jgi:hypothetical protein
LGNNALALFIRLPSIHNRHCLGWRLHAIDGVSSLCRLGSANQQTAVHWDHAALWNARTGQHRSQGAGIA